jgi:hypothetical protein
LWKDEKSSFHAQLPQFRFYLFETSVTCMKYAKKGLEGLDQHIGEVQKQKNHILAAINP